jgi:spermidine synthase
MREQSTRGLVLSLVGFLCLAAGFGAMALVTQVLLLRQLLVAFYGSELVIALVMAGWLTGVFLGARIAGLFMRRNPSRWLLTGTMAWLLVAATALTLSYLVPGLSGLAIGEVATLSIVAAWSAGLTIFVSLFVGLLFVAAGGFFHQIWPDRASEGLGVGGTVFWAESAGACLGLLFYTFFLIDRVGPCTTFLIFAGLVLFCASIALPRLFSTRVWSGLAVILVAGLVVFSGVGSWLDRTMNQQRFKQVHPTYDYVTGLDTPYQHLTLASHGDQTVLFGNQTYLAEWPDPYSYERLALFFLTETAQTNRILLAGQGPGGFIHPLLRQPIESLVYVALDSGELELIEYHLPPDMAEDLKDRRLTIVHDDIRRFLNTSDAEFDLIIINAPDPDNARVNRLYTREFFESARNRLSQKGVMIASIAGADHYWGEELQSYGVSLYATLKSVFKDVLVTPGDRHYLISAVAPGIITDKPGKLADRYRDRGFQSTFITPRGLIEFFPPSTYGYLKEVLDAVEEERNIRLNTDVSPLTYYLRLIWWERMTGSETVRAFLSKALDLNAWGPWAAGLIALPFLFLFFRPGHARGAVLTVMSTGATTMALQILLIFMYQNRYGVIYEGIALLSALFMAGLALGGMVGRLAVTSPYPAQSAALLDIGLALTAVTTALCAHNYLPDLILPLVAATGLFSGAQFSLLFSLYMQDPKKPAITKGLSRLESADHGGAAFGAVAAGLILVPVAGLGLTAGVLAGFKVLGGLALLRLPRR